MTEEQCKQAMELGAKSVEKAVAEQASLFVAGEMGIGNTCSASAVACLLLNEPAEKLTGVGTGIRQEQLSHKSRLLIRLLSYIKVMQDQTLLKFLVL